MLLNNNGILSSDNQTKHKPVRYFLSKDIISIGYLKVKYFPTGEIFSDHVTKPSQGDVLWKFLSDVQEILEVTPDT